ncbi:hypothetical protein ACOBQX_07740 [Actinokineospora sp. G85]|uniref:hypothetical protein n=1 Tax=Actinokineospora sp. G85 TaxID=3406626 RepID=UPI003C787395
MRVEIDSVDLRPGSAWRDDLTNLGAEPSSPDQAALIRGFEAALSPRGKAILADIRRAAVGFTDGHPVHYPRPKGEKQVDGKNYEWFTENERADKVPLPLFGSHLREYDGPEERKREEDERGQQRQRRQRRR